MIPNANIEGASFLYIIDLIATILSFVGSLTMCYLCLRMKAPRTISHKFILAISVADFFYSISNILSNFETKDTTKLCFIEGFIRESAFILTIFFSTCTAVASLRIFWANSDSENKSLSRSALIIGPALCFCMSVLLPLLFPNLIFYQYGPINCSISMREINNKFAQLLFYMIYTGLPVIIGLLIILMGYIYAISKLRHLPQQYRKQLGSSIYKLLIYPGVLVVIFLPSVIDHVVGIFYPHRSIWITTMRLGLSHSVGFINAVMYIFLRKLYRKGPVDIDPAKEKFDLESDGSMTETYEVSTVGTSFG